MDAAAKEYLAKIRKVQEDDEEGANDVAEILKQDALESMGHLRRLVADTLVFGGMPAVSDYSLKDSPAKFYRGHKLSVTAVALSADDRLVYSVSKDGSIMMLDVETGKREKFGVVNESGRLKKDQHTGAPWVAPAARQSSKGALLAVALSGDGKYLAVGGGDKKIHVWDARSRAYIRGLPGHKDTVTALSFREGSSQLFSGSMDRSVKLWSLEDMTYMDTLFGHQGEVLGLDSLRAERALSCGADRTCRVWKIPEESQLVFRGHNINIESCAYISGGEWVSGDASGSVQLWNSAKKRPIYSCREAHVSTQMSKSNANHFGAGSIGGDACSWVGSIAVCYGSDLVASGAGDGTIAFWKVWDGGKGDGGRRALEKIGSIPARGFVNSLAIARNAKFVVAGLGQEPRLGRWLRDPVARNGIFIHPIQQVEDSDI